MYIFQEYDSPLERECDILFRQFEIDVSRLENEFMLESSISEIEGSLFCETETLDITNKSKKSSDKNQPSKFTSFIKEMGRRILQMIDDIIQMFSNMFSNKSHMDIEAYLNSSTGSIEMDNDLIRVQHQVNTDIREGRKLIQAISKGTRIDDAKVEAFVDKASKGALKYGKVLVATAGSYALFQKATGGLESLKKEMSTALEDCKDASGDPKKEIQIKKVYTAMRHWISEATHVYSMFGKKIQEEAIKQQKNTSKNKKGGDK